jgi:hypothetical protein
MIMEGTKCLSADIFGQNLYFSDPIYNYKSVVCFDVVVDKEALFKTKLCVPLTCARTWPPTLGTGMLFFFSPSLERLLK